MPITTERSKTVLVVDDDPEAASLVASLLTYEGYEVSTASNGLLAIESIARGARPAVIILDMLMPVMDGQTFLNYRRADPVLARTPVIAVSGTERVPEGVNAFMRKPFEPDELLAVVRALSQRAN